MGAWKWLSSVMAALSISIALLYRSMIASRVVGGMFVLEDPHDDLPIEIELLLSSSSSSSLWLPAQQQQQQVLRVNASSVWSLSYEEARTKFRMAVQAIQGAELHTLPILSTTTTTTTSKKDDDDDDAASYTMDIAILPGTHSGTIVHLSGTHGIEGYAGSAIQLSILSLYYLQQQQQQQQDVVERAKQHPQRPTVVLIHAVNPYGMKHYRRPNENNVDLNRNAIRYPQDAPHVRQSVTLDVDLRAELVSGGMKRRTRKGDNGTLFPMTPPPQLLPPPTYYDGTIGYWKHVGYLLYKYGYQRLKRVIVTGQYTNPNGIMYGGTNHLVLDSMMATTTTTATNTSEKEEDAATFQNKRMEVSVQSLYEFLTSHGILQNIHVLIDVHTGLGPFGKDTVMSSSSASSTGTTSEEQTLSFLFPTAASIVTRASQDKAAMSGYDVTVGFVVDFLQDAQEKQQQQQQQQQCRQGVGDLPTEDDSSASSTTSAPSEEEGIAQGEPTATTTTKSGLFLVQEFGTIPGVLVARALILENWIHHALLQQQQQQQQQLSKEANTGTGTTASQADHDEETMLLRQWGKSLTRDAFYPQSTQWRRSIVQRGVALFQQAMAYSNSHESSKK
jgi:hypothetical protein